MTRAELHAAGDLILRGAAKAYPELNIVVIVQNNLPGRQIVATCAYAPSEEVSDDMLKAALAAQKPDA